MQQLVYRNESDLEVVTEQVFGECRLPELSSYTESQTHVEEPCQDTKILFRSQNYPASVSSTKSRSKILRYNHTNNLPPATPSARESVSSISVKCLRKKLPFSEFQLYVAQAFGCDLMLM